MMNSHIRRVLIYIKMTMLLTALSAVVLLIGGIPVAKYIIGTGNKLIYDGAPADLKKASSELSLLIETGNHPEQSEGRVVVQEARIGSIECARIALSAPLYEGDSEAMLSKGAGHYAQSAIPGEGKVVLISGHDATFFAPLEQIAIGDVVKVVMEDKDYYYGIVSTRVADKSEADAYDLSLKEERLILYTCYPFGQILGTRNERYFVYGEPLPEDVVLQKE